MKKKKKIIVFLFTLGFLFYRYFFYLDISNMCMITIKPSFLEWSNSNIKRAIKTLKYGSPDDYRTFCAYVDTVDPTQSCGGFGGGCFYPSKKTARTIDIGTSQRNLAWTAAIIMHETCHVIQYKEGRPFDENECYNVDNKTIKTLVNFPEK